MDLRGSRSGLTQDVGKISQREEQHSAHFWSMNVASNYQVARLTTAWFRRSLDAVGCVTAGNRNTTSPKVDTLLTGFSISQSRRPKWHLQMCHMKLGELTVR